jgi:hypothetical protein
MKRNQTNKMQLETQTKEEQINVVKELCKITNVLRCNKQLNAQKKKRLLNHYYLSSARREDSTIKRH